MNQKRLASIILKTLCWLFLIILCLFEFGSRNLIYALAQRDENIASYDFALSQVDVDYSGWEEYIDTNIR